MCKLTLYSTRSDEPRSRGDTRSLVSTPLAGANLGTATSRKMQGPPAYCSLHPCKHAFSEKEAADSLLSGKRRPLLPRPRAPGSGPRGPAALVHPRRSHRNTWAPGPGKAGGDAARSRKKETKRQRANASLAPLPRRSSKLAFFSAGHSALPSSRQAAAGTFPQPLMSSSWRVRGAYWGGGCLSGSSGGCLGLSRRFVAKKPFCSVMRRSTACNRGPNLGQLQGSPPQDGCAHASSPGSLPLRPHHPKQQKESRRRPFRSSLRSSPSNPIAAEDPTAAFGLQDVHTYINRKLKEKNTYKQRCHREAS